jgi:5'-nucleotidase
VLVAGHTHQFNNTMLNDMLITQAFSYSTAFADIDLTIDRAQREIVDKRAQIITTFNDGITPDPDVAALVKKYTDQVAPKINEVIGTAAELISATQNDAGESPLGNLIADAQRDAMGTQLGVTNPGGIRVPQIEAGPVTYAALFAAQPFANDVVKMKLTGDQIYKVLNQQWQPQSDGTLRTRFLQISGFSYSWSDSRPIGDKILEVRGPGGAPIDRGATYSIALNSFLSTGGDGFTIFNSGAEKVTGPVDLDALIQYVRKLPQPFDSKIDGRIMKQ